MASTNVPSSLLLNKSRLSSVTLITVHTNKLDHRGAVIFMSQGSRASIQMLIQPFALGTICIDTIYILYISIYYFCKNKRKTHCCHVFYFGFVPTHRFLQNVHTLTCTQTYFPSEYVFFNLTKYMLA